MILWYYQVAWVDRICNEGRSCVYSKGHIQSWSVSPLLVEMSFPHKKTVAWCPTLQGQGAEGQSQSDMSDDYFCRMNESYGYIQQNWLWIKCMLVVLSVSNQYNYYFVCRWHEGAIGVCIKELLKAFSVRYHCPEHSLDIFDVEYWC